MLYVAVSRVTTLSGLFIIGEFKLPNAPKNYKVVNSALAELARLRANKILKLSYDNLETVVGTKVCYMNIGTLRQNFTHIIADKWYLRTGILIFSESLTSESD